MSKGPKPDARGRWRFVPYIKPSGRSQVLDYLEKLKTTDFRAHQALVTVVLTELEENDPFVVGGSYWKALGDGYHEVRSGRERLYCRVVGSRIIAMLVGRTKLWREFRDSDRKLCEAARSDIETGGYDQETRQLLYLAYLKRRGQDGPA